MNYTDFPHLIGGVYEKIPQYNQYLNVSIDDFATSSALGEITSKLLRSKQITPYEAIYVGSAEINALCKPNKQWQWKTALKTVDKNPDFLNFLARACKQLDCHDAFYVACSSGNLLAAQWLIRTFPHITKNTDKIIKTFSWTCSGDHIHVARWLIKLFPDTIDHGVKNGTFIGVCMHGAFTVMQWLKHITPDLDYRFLNDLAFRMACGEGRFQIVRWLIRTFPDINHREFGEDAFILACRCGYLHVVQWLLRVFSDIDYRIRDDEALYQARKGGHAKIVAWLELYI